MKTPLICKTAVISLVTACVGASSFTSSALNDDPPHLAAVQRSQRINVRLPAPVAQPFFVQMPEELRLSNGLTVLLQTDHSSPFVSGTIFLRGGSRDESPSKAGLALLYATVLSSGGTSATDSQKFSHFFTAHGALLTSDSDPDKITIKFSSWTKDWKRVLALVAEMLRSPLLDQKGADDARTQLNAEWLRRHNDVQQFANNEAIRLGYGDNSALGRRAEPGTLNSITQDDLRAWQARHSGPQNTLVGITGDFDPRDMEAQIIRLFGTWPQGPPCSEAELAIDSHVGPEIYIIDKKGFTQSAIRVVGAGLLQKDPDYPAIQVLNRIFSIGNRSRLMTALRTSTGVSYDVGGSIGAQYGFRGLTFFGFSTQTRNTTQALRMFLDTLDDLHRVAIAPTEFDSAKSAVLNSFLFNFDSREKVMLDQLMAAFYGYPRDAFIKTAWSIYRVKLSDVNAAAAKFLDRKKLAIIVVGDPAHFDVPVETLGMRTEIRASNDGTRKADQSASVSSGAR